MIDEKKKMIAAVVNDGAGRIIEIQKKLPKIAGKRNPFAKSFHRRPMRKQKTDLVMHEIAYTELITSLEIQKIISIPIPKFLPGSIAPGQSHECIKIDK